MSDLLIVRSKAKDYAKKKKIRLGSDAIEQLNKEVMNLIDKAIERTRYKKEGTIKARHV